MPGPVEKLASVVPPAVGLLLLPSGSMSSTEFVTNATSTSGGAVNRPFTFILKTCPAIGSDPRLAGLLKFLVLKYELLKLVNRCNGKIIASVPQSS